MAALNQAFGFLPALAIRYVYWLKKETIIDKSRATTACTCSFAVMMNEAPLTQLSGEVIYCMSSPPQPPFEGEWCIKIDCQ
ncbi:hypothetical protein [Candidatus Symbiopectobacterium sp.]|uniref:hypothetical protein n=1 Tax=Candidatus Symbiopectobacterium sp. TaxID=2816440 RepID=UPI0025BB69A3|nr:hypothetical protein [Candidatus Symbiopectobacterium sp.]